MGSLRVIGAVGSILRKGNRVRQLRGSLVDCHYHPQVPECIACTSIEVRYRLWLERKAALLAAARAHHQPMAQEIELELEQLARERYR